jgi:hypothetical protein
MNRGVKYSLSDLLFQITENNYRFVRIYDGWLQTITDADFPIRVLRDCASADDMKEKITDFVKRFPYRLTLLFKVAESNTGTNAVLVHFEPDRPGVVQAVPVNGSGAAANSMDAFGFAIELERLRAEMRERDIKREKEEVEQELEFARSQRAKWETIADIVLPKILPLFGVPSALVTGKVQPMQGAHNEAGVDADELEKAIDFLCDTFGMDGVIKLAHLLKTKPEFINLVKSQIS